MKVQPGSTYMGREGEVAGARLVIAIDGDQLMYQRRHGPPETVDLADFERWADRRVGFFMGRWAEIPADALL